MPGMLRHVALQGRTDESGEPEGGSGWEGYIDWEGGGGGITVSKSDQGLWPYLASNVF